MPPEESERGIDAYLDEVLYQMEKDSLVCERNERFRESEGQRTKTSTETCTERVQS